MALFREDPRSLLLLLIVGDRMVWEWEGIYSREIPKVGGIVVILGRAETLTWDTFLWTKELDAEFHDFLRGKPFRVTLKRNGGRCDLQPSGDTAYDEHIGLFICATVVSRLCDDFDVVGEWIDRSTGEAYIYAIERPK